MHLQQSRQRRIDPGRLPYRPHSGVPQLLEIVQEQAAALRYTSMSFDAVVAKLTEYAPAFGPILRELAIGKHQASEQITVPDVPSGDPPAGEA